MKMKVIKITRGNEVAYLNGVTIFDRPVASPLEAFNYALPENESKLAEDIETIHLAKDEIYVRCGIQVDSAQVVELEVIVQEISCVDARTPHKAKEPT